ncbi:hypothetical protein ADUPG1_006441, partial [Aduncisulcus paluster]
MRSTHSTSINLVGNRDFEFESLPPLPPSPVPTHSQRSPKKITDFREHLLSSKVNRDIPHVASIPTSHFSVKSSLYGRSPREPARSTYLSQAYSNSLSSTTRHHPRSKIFLSGIESSSSPSSSVRVRWAEDSPSSPSTLQSTKRNFQKIYSPHGDPKSEPLSNHQNSCFPPISTPILLSENPHPKFAAKIQVIEHPLHRMSYSSDPRHSHVIEAESAKSAGDHKRPIAEDSMTESTWSSFVGIVPGPHDSHSLHSQTLSLSQKTHPDASVQQTKEGAISPSRITRDSEISHPNSNQATSGTSHAPSVGSKKEFFEQEIEPSSPLPSSSPPGFSWEVFAGLKEGKEKKKREKELQKQKELEVQRKEERRQLILREQEEHRRQLEKEYEKHREEAKKRAIEEEKEREKLELKRQREKEE